MYGISHDAFKQWPLCRPIHMQREYILLRNFESIFSDLVFRTICELALEGLKQTRWPVNYWPIERPLINNTVYYRYGETTWHHPTWSGVEPPVAKKCRVILDSTRIRGAVGWGHDDELAGTLWLYFHSDHLCGDSLLASPLINYCCYN